MRGKRVPPPDPVDAHIRIKERARNFRGVIRVPNCGRCGQRLPDITCYLDVPPERLARGEPPGFELSPSRCYIDNDEIRGWVLDGQTLRPTKHHRDDRRRV